MSRLPIRCRQYKETLCLLASGLPLDRERDAAEKHLATCANCQKYFHEMKSVVSPLVDWEETYSDIRPSQSLQARWTKDFQAATIPLPPRRFLSLAALLDWCHDMIWPCRRIWAGFAAAWVGILAINLSTRDPARFLASKSSRPSPEMVRAFLEGEGFLADLAKPGESLAPEPPKPVLPKPRSERRPGTLRA